MGQMEGVERKQYVRLRRNSANFCFQAEDGIRDAQESRGLGDVYR